MVVQIRVLAALSEGCVPAPATGRSQMPATSTPKNLMPFVLDGSCTHIYAHTHTNMFKK